MGRWVDDTFAERFWSKVQKTTTCWLWSAAKDSKGYGVIKREKLERAHRVVWELEHGAPATASVLHSCDVRNCVNPSHLSLGTQAENIRQAQMRGRFRARGGVVSVIEVAPWRTEESRFWSKVRCTEACWEWTGSKTRGYGDFVDASGRKVKAHRWSFAHALGRAISAGLDVMHLCDNPSCVRPEHLKEGTTQENIDDMMAKGRHRRRSASPNRAAQKEK